MNFLKYIFELILVFYIIRFAVRAIDGFLSGGSKKDDDWKINSQKKSSKISTHAEDMDYEEVK